MSSEKCMRHKGVLHKKGYPLHDEFMKDGRLFILGDSWGRKRWDGGPQTKKPTKTTEPSFPGESCHSSLASLGEAVHSLARVCSCLPLLQSSFPELSHKLDPSMFLKD